MQISVEQYLEDPAASQRQEREIKRVDGNIRDIILEFCRLHLFDTFHMDDLREYVKARTPIAPDIASRILRLLRKEKKIDYKVVSRKDSKYSIGWVSD